ncbi:MAG: PAC2 family protein [Euryarchaeota archaeon]|nr:PAC2 family protein [Euryarchaeota archaeon]
MGVEIRDYKEMDLDGGTLIVSIPHVGVGNLVVTDFLLEDLAMDQIACLDAEEFPPLAMIRQGKARFPARIHASPATRVALLRSEFALQPAMVRAAATAILGWAREQGIARIIVLDGLRSARTAGQERAYFASTSRATREAALAAHVNELHDGVLGGVGATLLLEGRFQGSDVTVLLVEAATPVEEAHAALTFAEALERLVPNLKINRRGLEVELQKLDRSVRTLQDAAAEAIRKLLADREERLPMYG